MKIKDSVALVTGANRGLGLAFAQALLDAGARKVYAGARDPSSVKLAGVVPIKLDVNDPHDVAEAARLAPDVNIVVNNAGILRPGALLAANGVDPVREQLETNFYGVLSMSRAFAPVLRANGGGALVNMLSALSWVSLANSGAYSISKAAAWALTNGLRNELREQGTLVVGVHAGYIDTDMVAAVTEAKTKPEVIARRTLEAVAAGRQEVLADDTAQHVKKALLAEPPIYVGAAA
jgi:NAD(P)-dependent dehydrogenase (short-subunit alcohol dehydrogenase family)